MPDTPLEQVGTAVADGAGVATLTFGPVPTWHRWEVRRLTVNSDSTDRTAVLVARNSATPANQIDSAPYSGNDDTTDTQFTIRAGELLVVQWTGATPGARCTTTLSGTRESQ